MRRFQVRRRPGARRGLAWRLVAPLTFIAAGALMVTSSVNSEGTDLRPGRYDNLADLAEQEADRVRELRAEVRRLETDVAALTEGLDSGTLTELEKSAAALEAPAGLTAVEGPGVTVTLEDAPEEVQDSAGDLVSDAIVHQQDIQAVVNALWKGGAEAVTLQGQRVVSTTGIKCVGNTVLLHGVTYSPPYVISAIGDVDRLQSTLDESPYIQSYLQAVDRYQLGWDVEVESRVEAPAYDGPTDLGYADPAGRS